MKIKILTNSFYPHQPAFVAMSDLMKENYCRRFGFEYVRSSENLHPESHPVWSKLPIILREINDCDWLVWMDCDAIPIPGTKKNLMELLEHHTGVVVIKDILGWNAGVFAVSNSQECVDWLRYIDSFHAKEEYQRGFLEQQAMADSFETQEWKSIVKEPDKDFGFNCYLPIYGRKGDPNLFFNDAFCLHLPACNDLLRAKIFSNFLLATAIELKF